MKKRIAVSFLLPLFALLISCNHHDEFPLLKGSYPVKEFPSGEPEIFGSGIICTGLTERDITISPDGTEIFFGLSTGRMVTIMYTRFNGKRWEEPVVAPFATDNRFFFFEPCFSPDGNSLFFLTTMPAGGKEIKPGWTYQNIFASDRTDDGGWSPPYEPQGSINEGALQFYPSLTSDRTLYFCRTDPATGKHSLFRAAQHEGVYNECVKLPPPVNTDSTNLYNVFVSPDESFMIACMTGLKPDFNPGKANYYLFIKNDDGSWSEPVPFGPEINIPGSNAMSSSVSPDGRYLFFAAQKTVNPDKESTPLSLSQIVRISSSPQNGNYDIYWTDAGVIGKMIRDHQGKEGER